MPPTSVKKRQSKEESVGSLAMNFNTISSCTLTNPCAGSSNVITGGEGSGSKTSITSKSTSFEETENSPSDAVN